MSALFVFGQVLIRMLLKVTALISVFEPCFPLSYSSPLQVAFKRNIPLTSVIESMMTVFTAM